MAGGFAYLGNQKRNPFPFFHYTRVAREKKRHVHIPVLHFYFVVNSEDVSLCVGPCTLNGNLLPGQEEAEAAAEQIKRAALEGKAVESPLTPDEKKLLQNIRATLTKSIRASLQIKLWPGGGGPDKFRVEIPNVQPKLFAHLAGACGPRNRCNPDLMELFYTFSAISLLV
jgi:hypothetical protein